MMVKQLLFYETAVPVNLARHRKLSVERLKYEFAADVTAIPLTAVEIPLAAREYTIVFANVGEDKDMVTPIAIVGIEGNKNVYVSKDGNWNAEYIPAFVRRYPFVFSRSEDEKQITLCLDESWTGCNYQGRGERLFDENDERTPYLSEMLLFLEHYQAHVNRTRAYCRNLKELDLLEPIKADFTLPDGSKKSLGGFMVVNRDKLKALPAEKLVEFAQSDELELTYSQLLSMNNFALMLNRVQFPAATAEGDDAKNPDGSDRAVEMQENSPSTA